MNRSRNVVAMSLLFFSGFLGLVYEFCWGKRLGIVLGNSGEAHSIVLATFMGGLAFGAFVFGKRADSSQRPLMLYGLLELGVGVYALFFPAILEVLHALYLSAAPALPAFPRNVLRLVCAGLALLPPTVLMGGTLPAMTKAVATGLASMKQDLSRLYACNSFGAAMGCLLAGVVMVPERGLLVTERTAAGFSILLAVAALVLGFRKVTVSGEVTSNEPKAAPANRALIRAALMVTALTGFTSMVYELTWIRVLSSVLGGTAYSFTLILTAFIVGISLGSFWLSRREQTEASLAKTLTWLQVGLIAAVCLTMPWYTRVPFWSVRMNFILGHTIDSWPVFQTLTFLLAAVVIVPPAFFLGACFPASARLAMASFEGSGQSLGKAYVFNTVGTVLGSLSGGLLLMPLVGLEGCLAVGLLCNALGVWVSARVSMDAGPWRVLMAPSALGLALLMVVLNHGWALSVANSRRAREFDEAPATLDRFQMSTLKRTVLLHQDDVFSSVVVSELKSHKMLRINGKVDASNGLDMETQLFLGLVGPTLRPVKRALVVGMGSGVTAAALLAFPDAEIDVVEISSAVLAGARYFSVENDNVLNNPRCHVYHEDARSFVALSKTQYDLIVSEPSNPWVAGVSELFTKEFYQTLSSHLKPDGLFVQWIHSYESNESLVKLVVRTVRSVFPFGSTWLGPTDLVLVASRQAIAEDFSGVAERMKVPAVAAVFQRMQIAGVHAFFGQQLQSDRSQKDFAGEGPLNTDDHNLLEYGSPIGYFLGKVYLLPEDQLRPQFADDLASVRLQAVFPIGAAEAEARFRAMRDENRREADVMRALAEAWYGLAPESEAAALAVARAALRQQDFQRVTNLMAPWVSKRPVNPLSAAAALEACFAAVKRQTLASGRPAQKCVALRNTLWLEKPLSDALTQVLVDSALKYPSH